VEHQKALDLVYSDRKLTEDEVEFVFENFQEGADASTRIVGAHFTPAELSRDLAANIDAEYYVDLFAGIGRLTRSVLDFYAWPGKRQAICVELNPSFIEVGRRLVPDAHWIQADLLTEDAADTIAKAIAGLGWPVGSRRTAVISNPPYGYGKLDGQRGVQIEYQAIEIGAALGAVAGASSSRSSGARSSTPAGGTTAIPAAITPIETLPGAQASRSA
ncbi:MAG: hypothetical protein ACREB5_06425, partial [Sphingomonadaceae bacterium]